MLVTPLPNPRRTISSGGRQSDLAVVEQAEVHGVGAALLGIQPATDGAEEATNRHARRHSTAASLTIAPLPSARERPGPMRIERARGERAEREARGKSADARRRPTAAFGSNQKIFCAIISVLCLCAPRSVRFAPFWSWITDPVKMFYTGIYMYV